MENTKLKSYLRHNPYNPHSLRAHTLYSLDFYRYTLSYDLQHPRFCTERVVILYTELLQVSSEMAFSKSNKGRLFKQGQPLSEEFRFNIISKLLDGGANEETGFVPRGIKSKVALELLIDKHCVSRAWESWITNRDVRSGPKGSQGCGKLDQNDLHYIEFLKREIPSITLRDIQEKLNTFSNKNVHLATICRGFKA